MLVKSFKSFSTPGPWEIYPSVIGQTLEISMRDRLSPGNKNEFNSFRKFKSS